ncbi:conserved hypothetical protein [Theileria orientalis strain Shintoku]|uniref:Uncharacterized protein n=1 Tax=Theileria orientalis strain Shintoku TaxID=869250 RepID=J4C8X5_THEOR|nr:conserved hypothetical protein [Theileria orientalis strain Shintoku]BAM41548.1 conserved hypothetical protein [Theileria orientalis strain Shintoku]|eukprot:XP_009691849.1 conserved hypothetical protein [Theileria orientalis strain Shintoku]
MMNLFSNTQREIKKETREFIERKIETMRNYNMYDIAQVLKTKKRIKVRVNVEEMKKYVEKNIETMLKEASIVNIYSMLNELSVNGVKLSNRVMKKIVEHIEEEGRELEFKELTNTYNSLSRHVQVGTEKMNIGEDEENAVEKVENMIETLYNKVLEHMEEGKDDFEGIVDVLDGTVNIMKMWSMNKGENRERRQNGSTSEGRSAGQVEDHSNEQLLRRCEALIERLKQGFNSSLEPKLVRILLRNVVALRYNDEELMEMIVAHYKNTHEKWSLQGNWKINREEEQIE